jgi:hypothetical protein
VRLLIRNRLCKKVVVVTRRKTDGFADPKVCEVVVNMDRLEEEAFCRTADAGGSTLNRVVVVALSNSQLPADDE